MSNNAINLQLAITADFDYYQDTELRTKGELMLSKAAYRYFLDQYDENYPRRLIEHCLNGASPESFAAEINTTPEIMAVWANMYPEFEIALHIAFWKSYAWWDSALRTNPDIHHGVFKLVMGQRFKWREDQKNIQNAVKTLSDKELKELALRLLESKEVITIDHEEEEDDDND